MKKVLLFAAAMLVCIGVGAQQALWSGATIVSPEIHADNSVTFRLFAPSSARVQLTGDFLPPQIITTPDREYEGPGVADLTRDDNGVWEYTSAVLAPELYCYNFIVDGVTMTDPSNVFTVRDVATVMNIFIIGGARADLYKVNAVAHGTVARLWYDSPTLGMPRRMTIYTPAGYEDSDERYPVLYLLHGMGGDEEAWVALGRTAQILDNLIAQGKAEKMIVVMTNGNGAQQAAPGEAAEGFVQPSMQQSKVMDGAFEEHFAEVVDYVDRHYRTLADKAHRAIAGLSMGGFHALHISKYYPDWFDYVGLFSAAIRARDNVSSPVYDDLEGKLARQFLTPPALYWIAIGTSDFLYENNVSYRQLLDAHGYAYTYYESDGGHIWRNWRVYLSEFVPQLFH